MAAATNDLPDDIDTLKAALLAANDRAEQVTAELAVAKAKASDDQALIAHQQLPRHLNVSHCSRLGMAGSVILSAGSHWDCEF